LTTHRSQCPCIRHVRQPRPLVQLAVIATALLALASTASPQYLETTILLPDTLGPLNGPYHMAWDENQDHPRLYIGGEADSGGVIVAEAITCQRLARIPTGPVKSFPTATGSMSPTWAPIPSRS
jgi:hypothetical protein